ncbi:MAG: tyrosine-type recombinase/integrase, partial [Methanomassiliicoccales archaeon]
MRGRPWEERSEDLNTEAGAVFVRQGKGGKDRYAPADVGTLSLCRCYAAGAGLSGHEPLVSASVRTVQRHMADAFLAADITWGPTCHTLRHTCATWQLDKGIPIEAVRENLGHEDIAITQIYLH